MSESNLELKQKTIAYLKTLSEGMDKLSWDILEAEDESIDNYMDDEMPIIRQLELTQVHNSMETTKTQLNCLIENLTQDMKGE